MNTHYSKEEILVALRPLYNDTRNPLENPKNTYFQKELKHIIQGNHLDISYGDVLAFRSAPNFLMKNHGLVFTDKYMFCNFGKGKSYIYYDSLIGVDSEGATLKATYSDGKVVTAKTANSDQMTCVPEALTRIAAVVKYLAALANGTPEQGMITHKNVDFSFCPYTSSKTLTDDVKLLQDMVQGYSRMPFNDPLKINIEDAIILQTKCFLREKECSDPEIALSTVNSYLNEYMRYFRHNRNNQLVGPSRSFEVTDKKLIEEGYVEKIRVKAVRKLIEEAMTAAAIISLIWGEIIKDANREIYNNTKDKGNGWFIEAMYALINRMERESSAGSYPIAYTAYSFFNTSPDILRAVFGNKYGIQSISELPDSELNVLSVLHHVNLAIPEYYRYLSKYCNKASIISHYMNNISHNRVETGYVVGDFEDTYYKNETLLYTTSSIMSTSDTYKPKLSHMPYYKSGNALMKDASQICQKLSELGDHACTCLLCENGEEIAEYVPDFVLRRYQQNYEELRLKLSTVFVPTAEATGLEPLAREMARREKVKIEEKAGTLATSKKREYNSRKRKGR